jgi:hypothetical protein
MKIARCVDVGVVLQKTIQRELESITISQLSEELKIKRNSKTEYHY